MKSLQGYDAGMNMEDKRLIMDAALSGRLQGCREIFQRVSAGLMQPPRVWLPGGGEGTAGFRAGEGLRASGALLAYALLGQRDEQAEAMVDQLRTSHPERSVRRLCQICSEMLDEAPDWNPASLYAAMRTVLVFLPESPADTDLPGLVKEDGAQTQRETGKDTQLPSRLAFARGAVIVYFELPDGVDKAFVDGHMRTREECLCGICLETEAEETEVTWDGGRASVPLKDPMAGISVRAGVHFGSARGLFVPMCRIPRVLWKRLKPSLQIRGRAGQTLPEMTLVSSRETLTNGAVVLGKDAVYLKCPALDGRVDRRIRVLSRGLRYLEVMEEG